MFNCVFSIQGLFLYILQVIFHVIWQRAATVCGNSDQISDPAERKFKKEVGCHPKRQK